MQVKTMTHRRPSPLGIVRAILLLLGALSLVASAVTAQDEEPAGRSVIVVSADHGTPGEPRSPRRRYFLDAIYVGIYRGVMLGFSRLVGWIDRYLVDGVLYAVSAWTLTAGDDLRTMQTGRAQDYVYGMAVGVLVLVIWIQWMLA